MANKVKQIKENRESLENRIQQHFSYDDFETVMFVYDIFKVSHGHMKQFRKDGITRYFEHLRQFSLVLLDELRLFHAPSLCVGIGHDGGEDTQILGNLKKQSYWEWKKRADFRLSLICPQAAEHIVSLTKPDVDSEAFHSKSEAMNHYITNMFKSDLTVMYKMVDRLINLRDMKTASETFIKKQIKETKEVYLQRYKENCNSTIVIETVFGTKKVSDMSRYLLSKIEVVLIELEAQVKQITLHEYIATYAPSEESVIDETSLIYSYLHNETAVKEHCVQIGYEFPRVVYLGTKNMSAMKIEKLLELKKFVA